MRTRRSLLAVLVAGALALAGCGGDPGSGAATTGGMPSVDASFPVTVGSVTVDKRPEKIVSLSPTTTEMLFAIGAGSQVTAVDEMSNYPTEAPRTTLSGYKPNAEAVAAKDPDLVVLSDDIDKIVSQLTALKIPVYLVPAATTLEETYQEITDLGALTGHPAEAESVTEQMRTGIADLVKSVPPRTPKLTYYYELDSSLYTVTSKTFIGSLFAMVGLENVADPADPDGKKGGYPQLSAESLIQSDPKMIFLADVTCCQQSAATVAARKGWSGMTAVKTNQIIALDDDIASRWGPRVVDLLRSITEAVSKAP
ncbi:ABC transporter substrate-binding protein [Rhizomonospora bruguierae]|uniref:ABC transporter substrate-binding protein n=1 Tax=Rhizomonospora bruguierae TaxID=1581705 RepID=UPI001BD07BC9|nr:ABC transporter substrate-binding protein [Micromonospora sp. NBRC 107566]